MTITIAHLSDIHLGPLVGFGPRHWNVKRALGYINWKRKRSAQHIPEVLGQIISDLRRTKPDHIAITGDLVNLGLPGEHAALAQWLKDLGAPNEISVVPGNHDIYTRLWRDKGVGRWQPYMSSDDWATRALGVAPHGFPYVRRLGPVALIGVNSAIPTPPIAAYGRVGMRQLKALAEILAALRHQNLFRLVLVHHPPAVSMASRQKALLDAERLSGIIADNGAELVLYGHNHRNLLTWLDGLQGKIPLVGIASASAVYVNHHEHLARYNLYRVAANEHGFDLEIRGRGLATPHGDVCDLEHKSLQISRT